MYFLKYNRRAAIAALAVIILLSSVIGANRSVSSLARKTETAYTETKVLDDLTDYVSYAQSFAAAYGALYGEDTALTDAIAAMGNAVGSPTAMTNELKNLSALCASAYYKLSLDQSADETVKRSATAYYAEMQSTEMRLGNNTEYKSRAITYNSAINTFPASLLAPGRKPAVLFG